VKTPQQHLNCWGKYKSFIGLYVDDMLDEMFHKNKLHNAFPYSPWLVQII
jgi:hypothetical protein